MTYSRTRENITHILHSGHDVLSSVGEGGSLASTSSGLDRVFIRDMIVVCRVGVYPHEKDTPQRVRININLGVISSPPAEDTSLADVVCYETLRKTVCTLMQSQHFSLVESLAEQVAEVCLKDWRVRVARVRLEKLEAVPDAIVGVEIERLSRLPRR